MGIIRNAARRAADNPAIQEIARVAAQRIAERVVDGQFHPDGRPLVDDIVDALVASPTVVNNVSAEPLSQSRTFVGSIASILGALAVIIGHFWGGSAVDANTLLDNVMQIVQAVGFIVAPAGAAMAANGRVRDDLAPMKWYDPRTWFGGRA